MENITSSDTNSGDGQHSGGQKEESKEPFVNTAGHDKDAEEKARELAMEQAERDAANSQLALWKMQGYKGATFEAALANVKREPDREFND